MGGGCGGSLGGTGGPEDFGRGFERGVLLVAIVVSYDPGLGVLELSHEWSEHFDVDWIGT